MKKLFTFIISYILLICICNNQQVAQLMIISVKNGDNENFYTELDSAVYYAQHGDTIYIPGGGFEVDSMEISKKLYLIGVGHYPDSTIATYPTNISGQIIFLTGSDSTVIEGCYITGDLVFSDNLSGIIIKRCNLKMLKLGFTTVYSDNVQIIETIVRGQVMALNSINLYISNSILQERIYDITGGYLKNNIFLWSLSGDVFYEIHNTLFENNIILKNEAINQQFEVFNSVFDNNLFTYNETFPTGSNVGSNNIVNIPQDSIFVFLPGSIFDYQADYHLKASCPGINAGTDGTDIGIFGTDFPFKEGSVPQNPHIQIQNIIYDNLNNTLDINIKSSAQER